MEIVSKLKSILKINNKVLRKDFDEMILNNEELLKAIECQDYKRIFFTFKIYINEIKKDNDLFELKKSLKKSTGIKLLKQKGTDDYYYKINNTSLIMKYKFFALTKNQRDKYYFDINIKKDTINWKNESKYLLTVFNLEKIFYVLRQEYSKLYL